MLSGADGSLRMLALLPEQGLNLVVEKGELVPRCIPDDLVLDNVVAVNQDIAKSDDLSPVANPRRNGRVRLGKAVQRFADDLKLTFNA